MKIGMRESTEQQENPRPEQPADGKRKQIILFMTDTTRKDMLGCYGNPAMHTPNLDALAAEGIRYENAYSCQPVCGPARSAIFTGQYPHSNGIISNCQPFGANVKTIGQRLSDCGIPCGYIGKYHLDGGDYFGNGICPEGWDPEYWYDMRCYLEELSEHDRIKSRDPKLAYQEGFDESFTFAHRCSDRALRYLDAHREDDFFLTVSYDEPHGPCLCPPPFDTMYKGFRFEDSPVFHDDLKDKPLLQQLWAGPSLHAPDDQINVPSEWLSRFLGCNSFVDYEIGRVLRRIRELLPEAVVIYTSDHGDMLGAHRLSSKGPAAYKEIANIPLIIRGGAAGCAVRSMISHVDLAPTILDYFRIPVPRVMEGSSLLPQIYDPEQSIHEAVYTEFTRYETDHDGFGGLQMMRAVTTERYKLVLNLMDRDEFYDLSEDPWEVRNRIDDPETAGIRDRLHDRLLERMNETRDPFRGYQWKVRPWRTGAVPVWENDGFTRQREEEERYEPRQLDYDTGLPMCSAVRKKEP